MDREEKAAQPIGGLGLDRLQSYRKLDFLGGFVADPHHNIISYWCFLMLFLVVLYLVVSIVNEMVSPHQREMHQASLKCHCLGDSYLPPSSLAAIADTKHLHHGQRPGHRPTSVRRSSPYQACQAAILSLLPSYSGHEVDVTVSVPAVSAAASGLVPLFLLLIP